MKLNIFKIKELAVAILCMCVIPSAYFMGRVIIQIIFH